MTDATAHWTALGKWTPSFFKEHYGSVSLTIDGEPHTMASFIDLVLSSPSREKIGSQTSRRPQFRAEDTPQPNDR